MAPHLPTSDDLGGMSPMAVHDMHLAKREAYAVNPADGSRSPTEFNNQGFLALFAILGAAMVLGGIWFFFWARNGGFKWRQNDWEDYKSTVLRRKGPDGRTLSNATKSTKLGGGSVVHGGSYGAPTSVGYTDYTDETATEAFSEMREAEEGRKFGIRGGDGRKKKSRRHEHTNNYADPELREYRNERAARVGGLNRQADGTYTEYSATEPSELGSNVSGRPLIKDKEEKSSKDKKKEAKDKERRAKERMRKAKLAEKEAAKNAAAEAKAQKEAEKAAAKKEKADQKKKKKYAETEISSSEPAMTEVSRYEAPPIPAPIPAPAPAPAPVPAPAPSNTPRRAPPSNAYSFTTGDDTATVYTGVYTDNRTAPSEVQESSYYSDYRPNADPSAFSQSRSRHQSRERRQSRSRPPSSGPRKQHRSSRTSGGSDIFTAANGEPRGTVSYPCHIPGLSTAGSVAPHESVSQVGAPPPRRGNRDVMAGYRRGGARRRDSLSDSDN